MKKVILCALSLLIIITGTMTACTQKQTCTVSFFNGNDLFYSVAVEYGEQVSFPDVNPTKESDDDYDYIFVGWKDNSIGMVSEEDIRAYGDINLYAVFEAKAKSKDKIYFTVTFIDDLTNEQIGDKQQVEDGGDAVLPTAPDHSDEGYTFDGWSSSHKNIKHTSTIRALYVKSEQSIFTLTRHYLGQTRSDSFSVGSEIPLDEPTINSAFVFEGWYFDEDFTEPAQGTIEGDLDIYAKISVDFSSAALTSPSDMVYGENNVVVVSGLKGENIIDYSYKWIDGELGESRALIAAGTYELWVEVTATYSLNDEILVTTTKQLTGSFSVDKAALSVTLLATINSVTYGASPSVEIVVDGFKYDDNAQLLSLPLTLTYFRADNAQGKLAEFDGDITKLPAGYYTVVAQMGEMLNYKMADSQPVNFVVTPKDIVIDFVTNNYSYGDELNNECQVAQLVYNQADFAYDDTISTLGTPEFTITNPSYSKNYPNILNAGSYNIALSGLSSENYNIQYAKSNATLRIAPKAASIDVTASDWTYGQDAQYSYSLTGILSNDEASFGFRYEFTKNGQQYVYNGERLGAGNYTVQVAHNNNSNYTFAANEPISFTVNKAELKAKLTFTNATKQNGSWSLTYGTAPEYKIEYEGFVDSDRDELTDSVSVSYYNGNAQGNALQLSAATYAVRVEGLNDLENYNFQTNDAATIVVTKKAFAISVRLSREDTGAYVYGETRDGLTEKFEYILDEFAYNDTVGSVFGNLSIELRHNDGQSVIDTLPSVGDYYATVSLINTPVNYDVSVISADFTINKAALDITLENFEGESVELAYGEKPSAKLIVNGFKGNDKAKASPSLVYIGSGQKFTDSSKFTVGNYLLKIEWADETVLYNYEWSQLTNTLKINPKDLTLTFNVKNSYVYGNEISFNRSFVGFAYGETEQEVFPLLNVSVSKDNVEYIKTSKYFEVGNYTVKISGLNNPNYNVTNTEAATVDFSVTKQSFVIEDTTRVSRLDTWTFTPKFGSEFVFNGTLRLNTTNAGIYVWNAGEHNELIDWQSGYTITLDGENVTDNFELYYNISVELLKSEFKFSVPNHAEFTYDGEKHKFAVSVKEDADVIVKVEYGIGDKTYSLNEPVFVNAGNYVVYYRLSAENYETEEGSFTVTGNKNTNNAITVAFESDTYVYDGNEHIYDIFATATYGAVTVTMNNDIVTDTQYLSDAGTYTFTFTVTDNDNYAGCELVRTIKIDKADYRVIGAENQLDYIYNAEEQGNDVIVLDVKGQDVTNHVLTVNTNNGKIKFIDADTYTVSWYIAESGNYNEKSGVYTVTIDKFTLQVRKENQTYTYDSLSHGEGISVISSPDSDYSVQYSIKSSSTTATASQDAPFALVNADYYTVYYRVSGNNYNDVTGSYTIVINPKAVTVIGLPSSNINREYTEEGFDVPSLAVDGLEEADKGYVVATASIKVNGETVNRILNKGVYTVTYTLSTIGTGSEALHKNYTLIGDLANRSFTVTVTAMKVTLDTSSIITEYDYNASEQTVDLTKVKIFAGGKQITLEELLSKDPTIRLEYSTSNDVIANGKFSFVNVYDADGVRLTIKLVTNANSNYGSYSTYVELTVNKIEFNKALPEIEIDKQVMRLGKTLNEISLDETNGYYWANSDTLLKVGLQSYDAVYVDPSGNYLPKNTTIDVLAERQLVTVKLTEEADYSDNLSDAVLTAAFTKGEVKLTEEELKYIKVEKSHDIDFTVGSTYKLTYVITLLSIDNVNAADYFDLIFDKEATRSDSSYEYTTYFKLKSVQIGVKYYTIEDALKTATGGTITVKNNTSFAANDVQTAVYPDVSYRTLKEGVILLLPYDGTNYHKTIAHTTSADWARSTFGNLDYLKLNLTIPSGIKLINNGTIRVGGMTSGGNGGSSPAGQTASDYAQITLEDDAMIESYGDIEAYGFIIESTDSNGSAVIMHKGTLTMPFVVIEHRGGSSFNGMYSSGLKGAPFNRFYMQNVTPLLTVEYDAKLLGHANLYASKSDRETDIKLIGNSSNSKEKYMFTLNSGAYVTAKYNKDTKITDLNIYGNMTLKALSLELNVGLFNKTIETSSTMFPISWYYNITLNTLPSGEDAVVDATAQDIKILPGASVTISQGVTVNIKNLFAADALYMDKGVDAPKYDANKGQGILVVNGALNAQNLGGLVQTEVDGATLNVSVSNTVTTYEVETTSSKLGGLSASATWDSFTQTLNGKIYSDSGLSEPAIMTIGEYTSQNGGWIKK